MRKAIGIPSLFFAVTLIAAAQTAVKPIVRAAAKPAARTEAAPSQLPVTRVSLYKNGVGFFEHSGHVIGNQSVTIDFTSAQLNDVLQSLTAIDLNGGRIAGAAYNSTTPLEQQLQALPLALGEDPTSADFYDAIRGARVEVHSAGAAITGRLLNIEAITTPRSRTTSPPPRSASSPSSPTPETVRTLELTSATEVRLLDPALQADVTRYLQLLANNRNQGLRHLTLQDNGTGTRELRVSYISEVPIWKSTYRILFTDTQPAEPPSRPPPCKAGPSSTTPPAPTGSTSSSPSSPARRRASSNRSPSPTTPAAPRSPSPRTPNSPRRPTRAAKKSPTRPLRVPEDGAVVGMASGQRHAGMGSGSGGGNYGGAIGAAARTVSLAARP